jgi:hypothetical protein
MGRFHRATITPTKAELIDEWAPRQAWGPDAGTALDVIGSFRFDDPDGRVGMETHLVAAGETLLQIPFTYRDEPLDAASEHLVAEMEHSELGTRWVYDGLGDPLFVTMLAGVTLTGQGEALGIVTLKARAYVAPSNVRIQGGGWTPKVAPVDGFEVVDAGGDGTRTVLANDRFELEVFRRPVVGPRPPIALTASWDGHDAPVVLAAARETARG